MNRLSRFALSATALLIGFFFFTACGDRTPGKPGAVAPKLAGPPPELNKTTEISIERRSWPDGRDNYSKACVFLNAEFKKYNTCAMSIQTDRSMHGVQVTDQTAKFTLLPGGSTLETFSIDDGHSAGETIPADRLKAGDVWHFTKKDSEFLYSMVFEILSIEEGSVTIRYQLKSFVIL